jgi:hypothetical protein
VFGGVYHHYVVLESHLSCYEIPNTQEKYVLFVIVSNLGSCNLHVKFFIFVCMFSCVWFC